jgi:hypothetical protein
MATYVFFLECKKVFFALVLYCCHFELVGRRERERREGRR